ASRHAARNVVAAWDSDDHISGVGGKVPAPWLAVWRGDPRRTGMDLADRDFIIEASWVLAFREGRPTLVRDGSVRVRGDRIEEVSDRRLRGNAKRVDASGQLLLPGFVSGHTHGCAATPTRGIIEGGRSFGRPLILVESLTDEELDDLTAFNLAEILRSGCTTHVEMSLSPRQCESYVRVAKRFGAR